MAFTFQSYSYNKATQMASFSYTNNDFNFTERIQFNQVLPIYDEAAFERALSLAFIVIGTSYYKTFPSQSVQFEIGSLTENQASFFTSVYQEGLSQFAFENQLTRGDLVTFEAQGADASPASYQLSYRSKDTTPIVLQSGGKDSLLLATLLRQQGQPFTPLYITSGESYPVVLDQLGQPVITVQRIIDKEMLATAAEQGALNGHVPVTLIVNAIATMQAILLGKSTILSAIGHEGEEPYGYIGDLPVTHQWAKTWGVEQRLQQYIAQYVSPEIKIGSPLRKYSELKIAALFAEHCWEDFSGSFSSCNVGNYKQGHDNKVLGWCGECAKCANSFLLFAPFIQPEDLITVFNGENLFQKPSLTETFKGLLGIDGAIKPFECIGEEAELRTAYHLAHSKSPEYELLFTVPEAEFNYEIRYPAQPWAENILRNKN